MAASRRRARGRQPKECSRPRAEPGYDRFQVARDIQNACNTSGIARELIRVIEKAAHDPECGRGQLTHDPAVVAVVDKLSSLMSLDAYAAHDACARRAVSSSPGREKEGGGRGAEPGSKEPRG